MIETAIKEDLILDKKLIIPKNKLDAIRIMNELHPVVGGQPTHEKDQPNDNNPILDLACTLANIHAAGVGDVADLRKIQNEPPSFFFEKGAMWGISSLKGNGILHVIGGWRDKSGLYAMMQFYYTTKEIVYRTAETEEKWGDWISVLTNESNVDYNKLLNVPITSTLSNDKTKISSIYAVNLVNTTASNAQKTANTAVANAKTADGKAVAAQSTANTAVTNAKTADGKAVAAQNTANTAVANAKTADGKAVTAQNTANTAVANAKTADGKAVAAQNTANTAVANAKTADGKAVAADKKAVDANNNANKRALKTEVMLALGSLGTKNLNHVTAPGNYFQTQNAQATTARNYPEALAGNLFVLEATGGATDCIQLYITYSTNKMFVRNKYGTTWSKWKESAEETDVVAAKKRADDAFKRVKPITEGGTGATTAANARKNLGIGNTVSTTGNSSTDAISQKAFTDMSFGIGQKWVDVTSQRVNGSLYTNNTGKPIMVAASFPDTAGKSPKVSVKVDRVEIFYSDYDGGDYKGAITASFVVPSGSSYTITTIDINWIGPIKIWSELRS